MRLGSLTFHQLGATPCSFLFERKNINSRKSDLLAYAPHFFVTMVDSPIVVDVKASGARYKGDRQTCSFHRVGRVLQLAGSARRAAAGRIAAFIAGSRPDGHNSPGSARRADSPDTRLTLAHPRTATCCPCNARGRRCRCSLCRPRQWLKTGLLQIMANNAAILEDERKAFHG
jgi:hypothetical protein